MKGADGCKCTIIKVDGGSRNHDQVTWPNIANMVGRIIWLVTPFYGWDHNAILNVVNFKQIHLKRQTMTYECMLVQFKVSAKKLNILRYLRITPQPARVARICGSGADWRPSRLQHSVSDFTCNFNSKPLTQKSNTTVSPNHLTSKKY